MQKIHADITFESNNGLVPEIEAREAAVFGGYTWEQWTDLNWYERAASVAHYRTHNLIEAHVNDAIDQYMKTKQQTGG